MNIQDNLLYTKEHEWIRTEGNLARMGITDYAQSLLGDITFVELPRAGEIHKQFDELATVESVKALSSIYAPISGKIVKVNDEIKDKPETINQSPYDKGWIAVIEIEDAKEKDNLLTPSRYGEYLKELQK